MKHTLILIAMAGFCLLPAVAAQEGKAPQAQALPNQQPATPTPAEMTRFREAAEYSRSIGRVASIIS